VTGLFGPPARDTIELKISAAEAAQGCEVSVCTPDGTIVRASFPPGVASGAVVRLEDVAPHCAKTLRGRFVIRLLVRDFAMPISPPAASRLSNGTHERTRRLRQNLMAKVMHDARTCNNLVEYERARRPNQDEETLLQMAIERWERDNH
jgi:DnaJ-class molecular chaperone